MGYIFGICPGSDNRESGRLKNVVSCISLTSVFCSRKLHLYFDDDGIWAEAIEIVAWAKDDVNKCESYHIVSLN